MLDFRAGGPEGLRPQRTESESTSGDPNERHPCPTTAGQYGTDNRACIAPQPPRRERPKLKKGLHRWALPILCASGCAKNRHRASRILGAQYYPFMNPRAGIRFSTTSS
jgi:hypothetical protein